MKANDQVPARGKARSAVAFIAPGPLSRKSGDPQAGYLGIEAVQSRTTATVCSLSAKASSLCDREPGEVNRARGNDLNTDAEKQERRQAGDDPSPFLSNELGKPFGVTVAE
jgi:hypothetical protein